MDLLYGILFALNTWYVQNVVRLRYLKVDEDEAVRLKCLKVNEDEAHGIITEAANTGI